MEIGFICEKGPAVSVLESVKGIICGEFSLRISGNSFDDMESVPDAFVPALRRMDPLVYWE